MEGVVLLLGQYLSAFLLPALVIALQVVLFLVTGALVMVRGILGGLASMAFGEPPVKPGAPPPKPKGRWINALFASSAVLLAATVGGLWFFQGTVLPAVLRHVLGVVAQQAKIEVTFETLDGDLPHGRVQFGGVRIVRTNNAESNFDLRLNEFTLDLSVTRLLQQQTAFDEVKAVGVTGVYERIKPADKLVTPREFVVDRLIIDNAQVRVVDRTKPPQVLDLDVEVDELTVMDLRSQWALFDVLYRSNLNGTLLGAPFGIHSQLAPGQNETIWAVDGAPVALFLSMLGVQAPLLEDAKLSAQAVSHWATTHESIPMDIKLVLSDLTAALPGKVPPELAALVKPQLDKLSAKANHIPISFHAKVNPERFLGRASPEAAGLVDVLRENLDDALKNFLHKLPDLADATDKLEDKLRDKLDAIGIKPDDVREVGKAAVGAIKNLLKKNKDRRQERREMRDQPNP